MLSGMFGYLIDNGDNIDPHRASADAASATGALMHPEIFVEILEFVVYPLPQPCAGVFARIVAGRVHREIRELAVVPGTHPLPLQRCLALNLVVDIKTMAGRAQECANAAADASARHFLPKRRVETRLQFGPCPIPILYLSFRISHRLGMPLLHFFLVSRCRLGKKKKQV